MAGNGDGQVVIQIDIEDREAEKKLEEFKENVTDTGEEAAKSAAKMEQLERGFDEVSNASKTAEKQLDGVADASKAAKEEIKGVSDASGLAENSIEGATEASHAMQEGLEGVSESSETAEEKIKDVGKSAVKTGDDLEELEEEEKKLEATTAAVGAACLALATGLISIGSEAVQAAMEFESSFAKTKTIMDANVMSASKMKEEILALSSMSGMDGATVSEAVYNAISGSVATENATAFVEKANRLAVAGFTSLGNATDVLTTTLNAYGLEAEKVAGISNVLITTQNLGKTSVDELAGSMGKAISTGSAYGVNLENLATMYVELTKGGIATAEATTYISAMLNELGNAGSTVGGIIQEETGKSFGQLMARGYSLADVLKILSDTVDGDAEALMGLWSSQEAGKASNAVLTQGLGDFNNVLSQMESEMSGATGTTERAYDTMTKTSEFIDTRFKNAVNNLGVAFGDNLSPSVDFTKKALTTVVETITGWVKESPAVTAIISGLTIGIGALGVALAASAIKAALATSEIWALTAAMMSNPVVLVTAGITALVAGIGAWISSSKKASEAVKELTVRSTELQETVESTEKAYDDTRNSIEGNTALARSYADRLEELESQGELTAEQQEEYNNILEKMKVVMPDLNIEIDEQTGLLMEGAGALQAQIDGWYELAVAQALQEKYTAQIQAQAAAEAELATNIAARNRMENEKTVAREKYETAYAKQQKAEADMEYYQNLYTSETSRRDDGEGTMSDEEYNGLMDKYYAAADDAMAYSADAVKYGREVETLCDEIDVVNTAIKENETVIAENAAVVEESREVYLGYVDGLQKTEEQTGEATLSLEEATEAWNNAAMVLGEAYAEAYGNARKSIEGQIGLFQKMKAETELSVADMMKSLDSQIAYLDEYAANMKTAAEMGIDQGLLRKLSDGSEESAGILAELVKMTDEQVQEMNEKFLKVSEGKCDFAEAMTEYTGVLEDEKQVMVDLAAQVGLDMSDSLTRGLLEGLSDYKNAWLQYQNVEKNWYDSYPTVGSVAMPSNIKIPGYEEGTRYAKSGLALVGEKGPELMMLRGGERILTATETKEVFENMAHPYSGPSALGYGISGTTSGTGMYFQGKIEVPLYIDSRELARASADVMGEEMEWGMM